ncbi:MAG: PAS domain S-box protein, partial [Desulfobacterales bacterium]|nr:PAS domain S-box protein [Desulfobacterales bacterium]
MNDKATYDEMADRVDALEEELTRFKKRFSSLVNLAHDGVVILQDDVFKFANRAMANILGLGSPGELEERAISKYIAPDSRELITGRRQALLAGEKGPERYEARLLRVDGRAVDVEISETMIRRRGAPAVQAIIRDISDRKRMEDVLREGEVFHRRLFKAEKMQSLGVMAGGVAHDLHNILSGIVSYPELIPMDLPGDSPLRKPLAAIKKSGERAAELISDLLAITRGAAIGEEVWNLNDIIEAHWSSPAHAALREKRPLIQFERR